MHDATTPPMASRKSSFSSFDDEYIENYLAKTYRPLSNLPTPPLSSHSNNNPHQEFFEEILASGEILDPNLLGPAIHITNLIPSSTSLTSPSVPLVHAILTRANLPLETVALAVCILDSLNSRFAPKWRQGCPLNAPHRLAPFGRYEESFEGQHIDSIHPELIVLSALVLAVKFLDDAQQVTRRYASDWGRKLWSCDQLNFTQRCILENLGYRLLPLWEESIISEALEDMDRAARQPSPETSDEDWDTDTCFGSYGGAGHEHERKMSDGKAVLGLGEQLTPAETPMVENIRGTRDLPLETKRAFQSGVQARIGNGQHFRLPDRSSDDSEEPFPVYIDPIMERMGLGR